MNESTPTHTFGNFRTCDVKVLYLINALPRKLKIQKSVEKRCIVENVRHMEESLYVMMWGKRVSCRRKSVMCSGDAKINIRIHLG